MKYLAVRKRPDPSLPFERKVMIKDVRDYESYWGCDDCHTIYSTEEIVLARFKNTKDKIPELFCVQERLKAVPRFNGWFGLSKIVRKECLGRLWSDTLEGWKEKYDLTEF